MKKALFISLFFVILVLLCGCKSEKQQIEIIIPAGSEESFVFSDEVFAATKDKIIVTAGAGFDNTSVTLKTEKVSEENAYEPIYLSHEEPVMIKVEKDGWFKIGVCIQNPSEYDIAVSLYLENIEIKSKGGE